MRGLKLAFRALSRHLWRTILTVLLFAVALGTLTFVLSPLTFNATNHYLNVLEKNEVKGILIKSEDRTNPAETVKKYLPENHRIFEVQQGFSGGTGIAFLNDDFNRRTASVFGVEPSDFADMGFEIEFGEYPKAGEYAISLAAFERLKTEGLTQIYDESGTKETRSFATFEELKQLLAQQKKVNPYTNEIESSPVALSGVVDTKYNEKKEAALTAAVRAAEKTELAAAESQLDSYVSRYGNLYVFARDTTYRTAGGGDTFLTGLPKNAKDKKALFQSIKAKLSTIPRVFKQTDAKDEITIEEERYEDDFYYVVRDGFASSMIILPAAILFSILSFFMMLNLASACGKSSAAEIAEQRERGMKSKEVYGVSLLRSVIVALVSFVVSVGIAYLCRLIFTAGGIVDSVLAKTIVGWDGSARHMVNFDYFGFLPFFISLTYGLVVAFLASLVGYRKNRIAPTEEDDFSEEED